jgi:hypothetical protein
MTASPLFGYPGMIWVSKANSLHNSFITVVYLSSKNWQLFGFLFQGPLSRFAGKYSIKSLFFNVRPLYKSTWVRCALNAL